LTNAQSGNADSYWVVVANPLTAATSTVATLTVLLPASIFVPPQGATWGSGSNGTLMVTAGGSGTLSYQWQLNGSNIAGATSGTLPLGSLQLSNAGLYSVVVSNGGGAVTSAVSVLNVAPDLSAQWTGRNVQLSWPGPYVLQSASNVGGAYVDILGAASPYLQTTAGDGQKYFRLRSVPFRLTGTNLGNAGFSVSGAGIVGMNFIIEVSTNLENWQPAQTNPSPFTFIDTNAPASPFRFYRAVLAH
jgi:hypothetical protein